jgi:hypothetical protein
MADRDYNNTGMIHRNAQKLGVDYKPLPNANPKAPDCRGKCTIDGKRYKIAGWLKVGNRGKFTSLVFQPDDEAPAGIQSAPPATRNENQTPDQAEPQKPQYAI